MVLISSCLIGENVKYNGGNNIHPVAKDLFDRGLAIPICPEVLGGMTTPRIPSEIKGNQVINQAGMDVSYYFQVGAQKTLEMAQKHGVRTAILQDRSPSCGSTCRYDGEFTGTLIKGEGHTTSLLREFGIEVITIEQFIERSNQ